MGIRVNFLVSFWMSVGVFFVMVFFMDCFVLFGLNSMFIVLFNCCFEVFGFSFLVILFFVLGVKIFVF